MSGLPSAAGDRLVSSASAGTASRPLADKAEPKPEAVSLDEWEEAIGQFFLEQMKTEGHAAASLSSMDSSVPADPIEEPWPGFQPVPEEGGCRPDSCAFGRQCIELLNGLNDCVLKQEMPVDPSDVRLDANYPLLLEDNNEQMRYRCVVLNAIWSAEGYACQETFEFPYIKRVPVKLPFGGQLLRWAGSLLPF